MISVITLMLAANCSGNKNFVFLFSVGDSLKGVRDRNES